MKRLGLVVAASALALVAACGEPVVGTVVGKEYDDADTYLAPQQVCVPVNGTTKCTTTMQQHYDPEHYVFRVQLDSDPGKTKKVSVDPTTYADTEIGDHYEESK